MTWHSLHDLLHFYLHLQRWWYITLPLAIAFVAIAEIVTLRRGHHRRY